MTELTERMRRAARAIYLATDAAVADDISAMLREAADLIDVSLPVSWAQDVEQRAMNDVTRAERALDDARKSLEEARAFRAVAQQAMNGTEEA